MLLGLFGTAVFFGDAVITPAITVLGAVEGIDVYAPQYHGADRADRTGHPHRPVRVSSAWARRWSARLFGPVMLVWFIVLALLGLPHRSLANPEVLAGA